MIALDLNAYRKNKLKAIYVFKYLLFGKDPNLALTNP